MTIGKCNLGLNLGRPGCPDPAQVACQIFRASTSWGYKHTWYPKQLSFNGWLSIGWRTKSLHGVFGWKSPFPSIQKWLELGFQVSLGCALHDMSVTWTGHGLVGGSSPEQICGNRHCKCSARDTVRRGQMAMDPKNRSERIGESATGITNFIWSRGAKDQRLWVRIPQFFLVCTIGYICCGHFFQHKASLALAASIGVAWNSNCFVVRVGWYYPSLGWWNRSPAPQGWKVLKSGPMRSPIAQQ